MQNATLDTLHSSELLYPQDKELLHLDIKDTLYLLIP